MKAKNKIWRKFEKARKFVRSLGLKDTIEWYEYAKSAERPSDIPSNANKIYKGIGWIDWPVSSVLKIPQLSRGSLGHLKEQKSLYVR